MPKFVTIAYGDRAGYDRTSQPVRDAAHRRDDDLRRGGALIGIAGVPVVVRNTDAAGVTIEKGAFMRSDLPIAGFSIIDADTVEAAIEMISGTPCAVAHGCVEVWPLKDA